MVQSHWKTVWIWESLALWRLNLALSFHLVIIYFKFEGKKNANYENKKLPSNMAFTIYAEVI